MRVIGGSLRGRRLVSFKHSGLRPTTDFVKEVIFNIIGPNIQEARVLDLFAGTGNLSIESYSRGAESSLLIENSNKSIQIIKKNLESLSVEKDFYKIQKKEVLSFLKTAKFGKPFDIIFIDPPFTQKMGFDVLQVLDKNMSCFSKHTLLFVEKISGEDIFEEGENISLKRKREYGDKLLCEYIVKS